MPEQQTVLDAPLFGQIEPRYHLVAVRLHADARTLQNAVNREIASQELWRDERLNEHPRLLREKFKAEQFQRAGAIGVQGELALPHAHP